MKNQKGITLVALIITIIVMLILAGVSISLVVGDNGVLTQAQSTSKANLKGALTDAINMANADIVADFYSNTTGKWNAKNVEETNIENYIKANFSGTTEEKNSIDVTLNADKDGATVKVENTKDTVYLEVVVDTTDDYIQLKDVSDTTAD